MNLKLKRVRLGSESTIGELFVDGIFECYVLEDPVREREGEPVKTWKIPGKTAIPRGCYRIIRTLSPSHKTVLPILLDVPGYEGIRIHPGNFPRDTEGCLLPGTAKADNAVMNSRVAFNALDAKIEAAICRGEEVRITIA